MQIRLESPAQPDIAQLIAELDAYQHELYPPESVYALDLNALQAERVRFAVVRDAAGRALGCGAVVLGQDFAEIKRMYVHPDARGQGLARRLLARLEDEAQAAGSPALMLETGPYQTEALALYEACGFARRGPFGDYRDDPYSVFMHKPLASHA
ncbi:GNAT family N-acetyltransferase [Roseateles sp. DAIF2]|uniref:GNAT family N-acetyltransferase n=1 Tax=Roseateles sp. DAIF2 TaxID=2714952 RepID=UPI0018A3273D|nr:GNAT family N-acetyltransferase [Roseateles sp. DAIF2]QPF72099.1 GNAT family N-acetyltransferase [Roseateles sp. DAIF2]